MSPCWLKDEIYPKSYCRGKEGKGDGGGEGGCQGGEGGEGEDGSCEGEDSDGGEVGNVVVGCLGGEGTPEGGAGTPEGAPGVDSPSSPLPTSHSWPSLLTETGYTTIVHVVYL